MSKAAHFFVKKILAWHEENPRSMPWQGEKNPYLIWLSEIILQQTRVEQGLPYFLQFKKAYPTVGALANAPEDEVMKLWQGLGYYSRARNLHATAKYIDEDLKGIFPKKYDDIILLKGVGAYTAAAIASFAFEEKKAVVDGNVLRVLARFFGIYKAIDSTEGKKEIGAIAQDLIQQTNMPASYNQAIMNFGALQCKPQAPDCLSCPLKNACKAYEEKTVSLLPIKEKKITVKNRFFHFLIVRHQQSIFLVKRSENDIWKNLYQAPMMESQCLLSKKELQKTSEWSVYFDNVSIKKIEEQSRQTQKLTHQKIAAIFYEIEIEKTNSYIEKNWLRVDVEKIDNFAFPKIISEFFKNRQNNIIFK